MQKKWILLEQDSTLVEHIKNKFNVSEIVSKILINRGITADSDIQSFLETDSDMFYDPVSMQDINEAVVRIKEAIKKREKIVVYGDYDVDGITSTFIVYDYLKSLGANVNYFIPDRAEEGYGLSIKAIDTIAHSGCSLIITVDLGITAINEVNYAKNKKIDIIITDHHTPPEILPDAYSVINPKTPNNQYPNKDLAGVGVAYKLLYALSGNDLCVVDNYAEFAAIGTIADMVPLLGENRYIASYGLDKIKKTKNFGILALIDVCGIDINSITSSNISYAIAPRLNAAGRIGTANTSIELFLSTSYDQALKIANDLDMENKQRQDTEQNIFCEAVDMIQSHNLANNNIIVVYGQDWHHGVIGIVSSKITEMYYKPSIVISIGKDGICKASARSIPGFNLYNALDYCKSELIKYGGHELAAGLSLYSDKIESFISKINSYAKDKMSSDILVPKLNIDAAINASDINLKTVCELKKLEPHGTGNPTPVFSIKDIMLTGVKIHKSGKHAFLSFKKSDNYVSPAFNMANSLSKFDKGDSLSVAGNMNINSFKGVDSAQFITKDYDVTSTSSFSLQNLRCIFVHIKNKLSSGKNTFKISEISNDIKKEYGLKFSEKRIYKALQSLEEAEIIRIEKMFDSINIYKGSNYSSKTDITKTNIYKEQAQTL